MNCFTKVFVSLAKEEMELLGRLVYHCRASHQVGPKTLAHACLVEVTWYGNGEYALLIRCDVIRGICSAIIELHVGKREFLRHLYNGDGVYEWRVGVVVWLTLPERSGDSGDPLDHGFHLGKLLFHCLLHGSYGRRIEACVMHHWRQGSSRRSM